MLKRAYIRQFLAVVETGSFTQAASRLHMTQPTLSAGIGELERSLGAIVFIRERKGIRLTEAGVRLLPIAREIEKQFQGAEGVGLSMRQTWPTLRIGVLRTICWSMLRFLLNALPQGIAFELLEGDDAALRQSLASGRSDFIFSLTGSIGKGRHEIPILTEPYTMFVSSKHPLARVHRVEPIELASETMIARRSCEVLRQTSRFFTSCGVRPRFSLRSVDDDRCMRMVADNYGITTAPASFQIEGIQAIEVEGYALDRTLGLLAEPAWLSVPGNRTLLDEIAHVLVGFGAEI